jgi:hypothetical protein
MSYINLINILQQKITSLTYEVDLLKKTVAQEEPATQNGKSAVKVNDLDAKLKDLQKNVIALTEKLTSVEVKLQQSNNPTSDAKSSGVVGQKDSSLMKERMMIETNVTAKLESYVTKFVNDKLSQFALQISSSLDDKISQHPTLKGFATTDAIDDVLSRITKLITNYVTREQVKTMIDSVIVDQQRFQPATVATHVPTSDSDTVSVSTERNDQIDNSMASLGGSSLTMDDIQNVLNEVASDIDLQMKQRKVVRRGRPPSNPQKIADHQNQTS